MSWQETNVMEQRIKFVVRASELKGSFSGLCAEFGISRPTGYRWVNRFEEVKQYALLQEKSRRPHHSPTRTPDEIQKEVKNLREKHGWGAKKLHVLLRQKGFSVAVITVNRILKLENLIDAEEICRRALNRFERAFPNELWQMDFKGEYQLCEGCCCPLSILDDSTRFCVGLHALSDQQGESVHACLIETFENYGVPQAMLIDHGTPWWSPTNGYGLTWLTVSLIKQGIEIHLSGVRHPQTQGKVERFHRTLKGAMKHRGVPETLSEWKVALEEFRDEYNNVRPHEALGMAVPASRYKPSDRAYNPDPPEWEYEEGAIVKRLSTQGCLEYNRHRYFVSETLAGERVQIQQAQKQLLIRYRHMYVREIDVETGRTRALIVPGRHLCR